MTLPSWWDDSRKKNNRKSAQQERGHAKAVGGRVQPGSGSSWRAKGDVRSGSHLTEMKFTAGRSFSLTVVVMKKIITAAHRAGLEPQLIIDFSEHNIRAVINFEELP